MKTVNQKAKDKIRFRIWRLWCCRQSCRKPLSGKFVYRYDDSYQGGAGKRHLEKKAAILKAYLIQNYHLEKGNIIWGLNEGCKEEAYVLGRLFAMLEAIQMDANPGIKATIRDRYFNSACATPAIVFRYCSN